MRPDLSSIVLALLLAAPLAQAQSQAQYKVVGPDGRITYTDRHDAVPGSRVVPLGRESAPPEAVPLPLELRQISARFPVTLYSSGDCAPCDSGRRLLQQRGIPYAERVVSSEEDLAALQRLTGSRSVPALTIGAQVLRGYLESDWQSYLDAANYPSTSKLPRDYPVPASTPLVARAPAADTARPTLSAPAEPLPAAREPAPPAGLRF
jgi:glutaredoxin